MQILAEQKLTFKNQWLLNKYKSVYLEILKLLKYDKLAEGTRLYKIGILKQIDEHLKDLDKTAKKWCEKDLWTYYQSGVGVAEAQIKLFGGKVVKMGMIHDDAIKVMATEAYNSFAEALKTVKRDAMGTIDLVTKQEVVDKLAKGVISGETGPKMAEQVKNALEQRGIASLVDKGGKRWQLDTYADMLTRTKTAESFRTGNHNRLLENGYDLVQISAHGAEDDCVNVEGKVYSLTGESKGWPTEDEIMEESGHIFGPNCRHTTVPYVPDLEDQEDIDEIQELSGSDEAIPTETLKDSGFRMDEENREKFLKED